MVAQFTHSKGGKSVKVRHSPACHISKTQWIAFEEKTQALMMEPEDFLLYWDCTYAEIAKICKCSVALVKKWFSKEPRRPNDLQKMWLGTAHQLLLRSR